MLPGNCFWAECKAPGKNLPKLSCENTQECEARETVHVLDSFEAVDKVLAP